MIKCPICKIEDFIYYCGLKNKDGHYVELFECCKCGMKIEQKLTEDKITDFNG